MQSLFVDDLMGRRPRVLPALRQFGSDLMTMVTGPGTETERTGTAKPIDFANPRDNLYAFGKIWGQYGQPRHSAFHGQMFARIGTGRLIPMFGYVGTGIIESKIDKAGDLWLRGKETGFFTDLASGEILDYWDNPWTGERVKVFNFFNDSMQGKLTTTMPVFDMGAEDDEGTLMNEGSVMRNADGSIPFLLPFEQYGGDVIMAWDYTHEYANPVDPARYPKASTGPVINPSEHFTFSFSRAELEDRSRPTVRYIAGFSRTGPFWPWMRMGGHEHAGEMMFGRMVSHGGLDGMDDLPPKLRAYVEKHHPDYLEPPTVWGNSKPKSTWEAYAEEVPPEV